MPTTKKSNTKRTPKTKRVTTKTSTKKTVSASKKKKKTGVVTDKDKQAFTDDIKQTMSSMGKVPQMIFAPIAAYAAKQYEKIPAARRKSFSASMKKMRNSTSEGLSSMKNWFTDRTKDASSSKKKPKKKTTAKKRTATRKPTAKRTVAKKTTTKRKTAKKTTAKKTAPKKTTPAKKA